jgi:hypothetical protein
LGENRDIFFPKLSQELNLAKFSEIAVRYLARLGYEPYECGTEDEARGRADELIPQKKWPCYFFKSDTAGEKDYEEFFTEKEVLDMKRFESIGVIKNKPEYDQMRLERFISIIGSIKAKRTWEKAEIVDLFNYMIPNFAHKETGKYLDGRM